MEVVVVLGGSKALPRDSHLSFVDLSEPDGVDNYAKAQQALLLDLEAAGIPAETLASMGATPVATYSLINAATLRVEASKAEALQRWLREKGHRPYAPAEAGKPADERPAASVAEHLKAAGAQALAAEAERRWGPPDAELGFVARLARRLTGAAVPQVRLALVGAGREETRVIRGILRRLDSPASYDVLRLDDALKALVAAAEDGNAVIYVGYSEGEAERPDALLARKLAEEGHVVVFGGRGPGSAAVYFPDDEAGADKASVSAPQPAVGLMPGPAFAGALALLMTLYGVTATGAQLREIMAAVAASLEKAPHWPYLLHRSLNAESALRHLEYAMKPAVPNLAARMTLGLLRVLRMMP